MNWRFWQRKPRPRLIPNAFMVGPQRVYDDFLGHGRRTLCGCIGKPPVLLYRGIRVWPTYADAVRFLNGQTRPGFISDLEPWGPYSRSRPFGIYGVTLPNGWEIDVYSIPRVPVTLPGFAENNRLGHCFYTSGNAEVFQLG